MDVQSGHVWATVPPAAVDGDRWTLLWWSVQEQGITSSCTGSDGGHALAEALSQTQGETNHQRDVWQLFPFTARVQGHRDRAVQAEQACVPAMKRQEECRVKGTRSRGRSAKATMAEQEAKRAHLSDVADAVRSLCQEVHRLLEVVVVPPGRWLTAQQRQAEIEVLLEVLDELAPLASAQTPGQIQELAKQIRLALPHALLCARLLDQPQGQASSALDPSAVALLWWAWLRRAVRGPTSLHVLQRVHPAWRAVAADLLTAWDQAVRARSAVEHWQSILRPHVAVHRTLSAGMLALLAVWHHHRIAPRGLHEGLSPFQRTDASSSNHHWLAALG